MKYIDVKTQHIRNLLYPIIGETQAKTYFSYYGIMKDGALFALYKNSKFYLHISGNCLHEVLTNPNISQLSDSKYGINSKSFYLIPTEILYDLKPISHWITNGIQEIINTKHTQYIKKKRCIRTLPNMTIQLERTLKKLGINSIDELIDRGEVDIFVNLLKMGIDADQAILFRLYGAINRQYIYTISDKTKQDLLNDANHALYEAGLRKHFNVK
ncbi:TfoX/Sxy family DNA transformation protein [Glaesserella parasuis]|uniref:TfoX/Sxy family DNA transformation protein n=1 Tax=Glaesserella parasuis TaxID=738 RepID=UPI0024371EC6|nr:TfoX/Sxy family DNA transformation protein [Glaesserella parasuis]MDG6353541.1 TfoX/Sxy family DNA transformation protein [Glaesserella parasuis]